MIDKIDPLYAGICDIAISGVKPARSYRSYRTYRSYRSYRSYRRLSIAIGLSALTLAVSLAAAGGEFYEDFHDAPNLSEGWTYGICTNTTLGAYSGESSQFVDKLTSSPDERTSLQIAKQEKASGEVRAEILSPIASTNISEWSCYVKRANGTESSTQLRVWGRSEGTAEWTVLRGPEYPTNKNTWLTNAVSLADNIRQVKFEIFGEPNNWRNCALDSLRIRTGEDPTSGGGDDPVTPPEPTKPTKLKLEATAPDAVEATWEGAPGEGGYRVELFRVKDTRETEVPDFSELNAGIWPSGWSHSSDNGFGSYSDGASRNVKISYADAWIASPRYPEPVTSFSFKFRSNSSNAGERDRTKLVIATSSAEAGEDWKELARHDLLATMTTVAREVDYNENVRRIRFSIAYDGDDRQYEDNLLLEFRVLSVTCGSKEDVLGESCVTNVPKVVFSNLNAAASYFVTVRPEPSSDPALVATSDIVDLSKEHFRKKGALPVTLKNLIYEERFDSLSNFVSQTKTAKMHLDYWQFVLGGAEPPTIGASQTNTVPNNAGCYVCRDKERISDIDSAMIGTLASGDKECAVGLAMRNDTNRTLKGLKVTFDSVQRSSNANPATYAFEWRISDVEASIVSGSDWRQVGIPETATVTSEKRSVMPEYRQRDIVVAIPAKLPPGKVLLLRWRHPTTTSGPMMAIDNVRIAFDKPGGNFVSVK